MVSFNPCFNGTLSKTTLSAMSAAFPLLVSILVLMELSLRLHFFLNLLNVAILLQFQKCLFCTETISFVAEKCRFS